MARISSVGKRRLALWVGGGVYLLTVVLYFFLGARAGMPAREPLVLGPDQICEERWECDDPAAVETSGREASSRHRRLRIASYNIHKCVGLDLRQDPARVAEVLRNLDADLVSLQEVSSVPGDAISQQMSYLAENSGMFAAVAGPTIREGSSSYGNALLSRFPILEVRLHDLSVGDFEPRGAIDADVQIGDQRIRVVATHFGLWPRERRLQVNRLLRILSREPSAPVIVLGDLNEWFPWGTVMGGLRARFGEPAAAPTFPSPLPVFSLDQIWIDPRLRLWTVSAHDQSPARIASDHLPLSALVILPDDSASPAEARLGPRSPCPPRHRFSQPFLDRRSPSAKLVVARHGRAR